jgi:hypothetical protein
MKQTDQTPNLTSFHGHQITATPFELELIFDMEPKGGLDAKTTKRWTLETESGKVFTVYDWKYYREIGLHEAILWNIGGHRREDTVEAQKEILQALETIRLGWIEIQ